MTPLQQINEKLKQLRAVMAPFIHANQTNTVQYKKFLNDYDALQKTKKELSA